MTNETELMPCPFCGEDGTKDDDGLPLAYYSRCMKYRYCECDNCGAMTRECDTRDDAIASWNTRADHIGNVNKMVPDGFVLVPIEPTEEMELSGHKYSTMAGLLPMAKCRLIYKAMIAAAQKGGEL